MPRPPQAVFPDQPQLDAAMVDIYAKLRHAQATVETQVLTVETSVRPMLSATFPIEYNLRSGEISLDAATKAEWDLAYAHISESGASHTYIDQDVTTTGTPQFAQAGLGIAASAYARLEFPAGTTVTDGINFSGWVGGKENLYRSDNDELTTDGDLIVTETLTADAGHFGTGPFTTNEPLVAQELTGGQAAYIAGAKVDASSTYAMLVGLTIDATANNASSAYPIRSIGYTAGVWDLGTLTGVVGRVYHAGSGTLTGAYGARLGAHLSGDGDITSAYGLAVGNELEAGSTGDIIDNFGFVVTDPTIAGAGAITRNYGLYIADQTAGTSNYAVYLAGSGVDNGVHMGGDVTLYRSAANILKTDDAMHIAGNLGVQTAPDSAYGINFDQAALDTAVNYHAARIQCTKTAGATDHDDVVRALYLAAIYSQVGGEIGYLQGGAVEIEHNNGNVGDVSNARYARIWYALGDFNYGTIYGDLYGSHVNIDQESAHIITGDVFSHRIETDIDGTCSGTVYMSYLKERTGVDYGYYQDGTAENRFGGVVNAVGGFEDNGVAGIDTTFLDQDGNTITVSGGIVTAKTAP